MHREQLETTVIVLSPLRLMPSIYYKHCLEPWFTCLFLGIKSVEGGLNKGDFAKMKLGDIIEFSNNQFPYPRSFRCQITRMNRYPSFSIYLEVETLPVCLPGVNTIANGEKIYRQYACGSSDSDFTEDDEKNYGVLAIHLEKFIE